MAQRPDLLKTATCFVALAAMTACGEQATKPLSTSPVLAQDVDCVQIEEGNYIFQNGKFIRAGSVVAGVRSRNVDAVVAGQEEAASPKNGAWSDAIEAGFSEAGYSWISLNVRQNTVILSGLAPDAETKAAAFESGRAAILAASEGADLNIIDGVSVEGGEVAVGAALAALDDAPSLASCQKAFKDTMDNRNVQFRVNSATVLPVSARLLDAVSGVAAACHAYNVEIGGHTDRLGDADRNLKLSQDRANSVLSYLASRGVDTSAIQAVGYGETRPIDTTRTRAGDALNRRTEFIVSER